MYCFKEENGVLVKYKVNFSRVELLKLKSEIIEKSSEIIHRDFETTSGVKCNDSLRIRNLIKFSVGNHGSDGKIYRYIYDEYKFPYLVSLIDKLLCGNVSALDEIFNINYDKELKPFESRIYLVSSELDNISNFNIREKRAKLDELEDLLIQYSFNKNRASVFSYYEQVLKLINFEYVEELSVDSGMKHILK